MIEKFFKIKKVFVSGGGRKNLFLMKIIKDNTTTEIIDLDKKKMNGDFIESQAFAYIAVRSLLKKAISFPQTTGVRTSVTGGDVYKV
jgi:anhydro-N-acetylmuramic acid kinase